MPAASGQAELLTTMEESLCRDSFKMGFQPSVRVVSGEVVEWLMALVLKTSDVKASVGSNPTLSVLFHSSSNA